jgi:DNA-binding transcriptional MocR family regulator
MPVMLFEKLAEHFEHAIREGILKPGERLPSIRQSSQSQRLSITTVRRAYGLLESRGAIEGRPQSGYFVREMQAPSAAPAPGSLAMSHPAATSTEVDVSRLVLSTLKLIQTCHAVPLASPYPDPALFPWMRIQQHSNAIAKRFNAWNVLDDIPPGHPEMIRQIARRHLDSGLTIDPAEVVVTVGATEAINLCLQAVAKPGDTVAIESPVYYAMLHAIERMGMRAVEVPTHPVDGMDLSVLAQLLERQRIDACMSMPNFQNPLGFMMPDARKREFVALTNRYDVPLVENGVYNELFYGDSPPTTLKSFDTKGLVLYCGSFSKSITAGVRIGWALPGRYREQLEQLKFLNTLATSAVQQLAIVEYLTNDGWDQHLRRVRQTLAQRADIMISAVRRFFPAETKLSRPQGGYLLWLELPKQVDTMKVYHAALDHKITIAPGRMYSNSNLYSSCLRLNYSYAWTPEVERAVKTLGHIVDAQMGKP